MTSCLVLLGTQCLEGEPWETKLGPTVSFIKGVTFMSLEFYKYFCLFEKTKCNM